MNGLTRPRSAFINWAIGWCGLLGLTGCGQGALQLLHSADAKPDQDWAKAIRQKPRQGQLIVIERTGERHKLPADSVWGYQTYRGVIYRLYGHNEYEVMQRAPLVIYRTEEWAGDAVWEYHYFSLSADDAIYPLAKKTCRQVFRRDECMLDLLKHLRDRHLTDTDEQGSYGLANAYQHCHSVPFSARSRSDKP
jgi:hypothetical protein